jgi:uncharacterized protein DUF4412
MIAPDRVSSLLCSTFALRHKLAAALLAAAAAAPAARAEGPPGPRGQDRAPEVYFEQVTVMTAGGEPAGPGVRSRVWFAGRKVRLEGGGPGPGPALILRLDQGAAFRLDPAEHTAERLDLEQMRAQSRADSALAGELMGAGEPDTVRTSPLPGKTVAGYECRGWRLRSGSAVLDVYTTTAVPVSLETFGEFLEWTGAAEALAGLWGEMRKLPGFPMETHSQVNVLGEMQETVSTVTRLQVAPVAASMFELPKGYRVRGEADPPAR